MFTSRNSKWVAINAIVLYAQFTSASKHSKIFSCLMHGLTTPSTLVLQFDGSLRYPRDRGVSTESLGRMGACAACILINSEPVRLGGKQLDVNVLTTSGEIEYEGLLLGLQGLKDYFTEYAVSEAARTNIVVEGDCKTLIAQMAGSAIPRKMKVFHCRATKLIQERFPKCQFRFQHIPREQNILCDRLSARINQEQQDEAYQKILEKLTILHVEALKGATGTFESLHLHDLFKDCFSRDHSSLLPYSSRPELYRRFAEIASITNDNSFLLFLGRSFHSDILTIKAGSSPGKDAHALARERALLREALTLQASALDLLERHKEAATIRTKNRNVLKLQPEEQLHLYRPDEFNRIMEEVLPAPLFKWSTEAFQSKLWKETKIYWVGQPDLYNTVLLDKVT